MAPRRFRVTGMALSAPQARFVWQVLQFRDLHRGQRKLGDIKGHDVAPRRFRATGVALSVRQASISVTGVAISRPS